MNSVIRSGRRARRGFTLTELIAVMTVTGAMAGVMAPLAFSASRAFAHASESRETIERCDHALRRAAMLIRESPAAAGGGADITTAQSTRIIFGNGARLELLGTTLWMATSGNASAPLCQQVDEFQIDYLGADGVTNASGNPTETHCVRIRIRSGSVELRTVVFLAQARLDS